MLKFFDRNEKLTLLLLGLLFFVGCQTARATGIQDGVAHLGGSYLAADLPPSLLAPENEEFRIVWSSAVFLMGLFKEATDPVFSWGDLACDFGGVSLAVVRF